VSVHPSPELETELIERFRRQTGPRAVGVTDLLAIRRAYYKAVAPGVPIPVARQARLEQGRSVHLALGTRLSREGLLEARVRREGIVGRIDILAEVPVEVKTALSLVEPDRLTSLRPDHLGQLGMYCALVGRRAGRLLTLRADDRGVTDVQALDVEFQSPDRVLDEMRDRERRLRTAWTEGRPDGLPRCPWFGRGCEFEEAHQCSCTGEEPVSPPTLLDEVTSIVTREDVRERVRSALAVPLPARDPSSLERFRDVLYPRRAYFERFGPREEAPAAAPTPPRTVAPPAPPDLFGRLHEALESGSAGEVTRLPPRWEEPAEEVVGFRGRPLLAKTSRAWARYRADELVARSPQYALEMGLRCAVTGTDSGVLVVGFERAENDRDRVQVLELQFSSLTPFSRLLRDRGRALAEALRTRTPESLPACPDWMTTDCPYRSECACAAVGSRVTR